MILIMLGRTTNQIKGKEILTESWHPHRSRKSYSVTWTLDTLLQSSLTVGVDWHIVSTHFPSRLVLRAYASSLFRTSLLFWQGESNSGV